MFNIPISYYSYDINYGYYNIITKKKLVVIIKIAMFKYKKVTKCHVFREGRTPNLQSKFAVRFPYKKRLPKKS